MKRLAISSGVMLGSMLAVSAQAATIGFWRMEESGKVSGDAIVSVSNSDGIAPSATSVTNSGAVASVYSSNVVGPMIYDPISDTYYNNTKSMLIPGSTTATGWNSYLKVLNNGNSLDTGNGSSFTAEMFFKETSASGQGVTQTYYSMAIRRGTSNSGVWAVQMGGPADYRPWARVNPNVGVNTQQTNTISASVNPKLDDAGWHHMAFVYDASANSVSMYLDYVNVGTRVLNSGTSLNNVGGELWFGRPSGNATDGANDWYMDEVRYSSGALNASQFLQLPEPASVSLLTVSGLLLLNRRK